MLRMLFIEKLEQLAIQACHVQAQQETARWWANRLLAAAQVNQKAAMLEALGRSDPDLDPYFVARLNERLHDEEGIWLMVQPWIEARTGSAAGELLYEDRRREAAVQMAVSNALASLRQLSQIDYSEIFETVSRVEAILRTDPQRVYADSSFRTRDQCRRAVERIARHSHSTEVEVAALAIKAAEAAPIGATRERHVGFYLLDRGLEAIDADVHAHLPFTDRLGRVLKHHATLAYLGGLFVITAALLLLLAAAGYHARLHPAILGVLLLLAAFPLSELAIHMVQAFVVGILPPTELPSLSFEETGIPVDAAALVVVPMMLNSVDSIRGEAEKLEVRFLGNRDEHLSYSLLADFADAQQQEMPQDEHLLNTAIQAIEDLNARYDNRFLLFTRPRVWSETQQRWIGWERKRGKLEELNAFLTGGKIEAGRFFVRVGKLRERIRYVITLDADVQLPTGTARALIETAFHPLNRPELAADGRSIRRGYGIIQPRVSTALPGSTATSFTRLFTDTTGTDPYCHAVSDAYQDLFGEGLYHGKALYDVDAFHGVLRGRFPEETLLSHDLIEGAFARVAYASNIEWFEEFPHDYQSYSRREHRWIRGDWQIARWIAPTVPIAGGRIERNPLSTINRWKVFDNLRRSLVPVATVLLLLLAWILKASPMLWSVAVGLTFLLPVVALTLQRLARYSEGDLEARREWSKDWLRTAVVIALLPHQSWLVCDAIVRSVYRLNVSKRHLLEWQTAEAATRQSRRHLNQFLLQAFFVCIGAAALMILLFEQGEVWPTFLYLGLWLASPEVVRWLGIPEARKTLRIREKDRLMLRRVARETWRYFDDNVTPSNNFLPPDNTQEALRIEVAKRTSPTNIGLCSSRPRRA